MKMLLDLIFLTDNLFKLLQLFLPRIFIDINIIGDLYILNNKLGKSIGIFIFSQDIIFNIIDQLQFIGLLTNAIKI